MSGNCHLRGSFTTRRAWVRKSACKRLNLEGRFVPIWETPATMSAQLQEGKQSMEGIQEVVVAASEQLSQIKEGITNLGATAMDVLDVEEFTELGISPAGSSGASSWMQQDTKPNLGVTSDAPLQIGKEFPYPIEIALPQFRLDNLGEEAEMALLVRIELHQFAK